MANIPRIHCHSAFKHYEMFHSHRDSGYGNSIFNTTYNFNGGSICGGGFWGGLAGGLGMGLGAGIMNFLFGGMGMFGGGFPGMGMFGGFPGMGMFGGGFPGFGGWFNRDGIGGKDTSNKNDKSTCEDPDREKINQLRDKVHDLGKKENITQDEIDTLKSEIEAAKKASDDNHKTTDDKAYDQLLRDLNNIKPKTKQEVESPDPSQKPEKTNTDNNNQTDNNNPTNNNPITNNNGTLTLHFGVRDNKKNVIDDNIKGHLIGVKSETKDNKTEISTYVIDSNGFPGQKFGLRYKITKNPNGTYNVKCINTKLHNCSKYKTLYINPDGVDYTVGSDGKLHNTGTDFVVSTQNHAGYKAIKYTANTLEDDDFEMPELDSDYEVIDENEEENIKVRKKADEEE